MTAGQDVPQEIPWRAAGGFCVGAAAVLGALFAGLALLQGERNAPSEQEKFLKSVQLQKEVISHARGIFGEMGQSSAVAFLAEVGGDEITHTLDLSNLRVRTIDLVETRFTNTNMAGLEGILLNLSSATLRPSSMNNARFLLSDARNARITIPERETVSFEGTLLDNSTIEIGSDAILMLSGSTLNGAQLRFDPGAILIADRSDLSDMTYTGAAMGSLVFDQVYFPGEAPPEWHEAGTICTGTAEEGCQPDFQFAPTLSAMIKRAAEKVAQHNPFPGAGFRQFDAAAHDLWTWRDLTGQYEIAADQMHDAVPLPAVMVEPLAHPIVWWTHDMVLRYNRLLKQRFAEAPVQTGGAPSQGSTVPPPSAAAPDQDTADLAWLRATLLDPGTAQEARGYFQTAGPDALAAALDAPYEDFPEMLALRRILGEIAEEMKAEDGPEAIGSPAPSPPGEKKLLVETAPMMVPEMAAAMVMARAGDIDYSEEATAEDRKGAASVAILAEALTANEAPLILSEGATDDDKEAYVVQLGAYSNFANASRHFGRPYAKLTSASCVPSAPNRNARSMPDPVSAACAPNKAAPQKLIVSGHSLGTKPVAIGKVSYSYDAAKGKTLYQVTTPPLGSKLAADSVCSSIRAQNGDCFVRPEKTGANDLASFVAAASRRDGLTDAAVDSAASAEIGD
ncbi:pentapeptide repeat-containing protein [Parvularcula bermudensis]|uniref:pentapeptide repeat-containing protein n=1 Tax=Parvularcula bermudensis TaxID=208216 RepID=UPI0003265BFE|nr:pentapeptide repeat-containing protein [Parvularcula bermudensis]